MATVECLAIQRKRSVIVERIATATDLTWFSGKLRENEFIDSRKASSVTSMQGVSTADKISHLLDVVEAKVKHSEDPHKLFDQFITIFKYESSLEDVSQILNNTRQEIRDHATSYAPPENDSREDSVGSGEDDINGSVASLPSRQDSSATWSTTLVQPAHVDSFEMENGDPGANAQLPTFHSKRPAPDGEGPAVIIATEMSVPHHESGTMQSSVMVHGSTIEQTPTLQSDSSVEDLFRPIRNVIEQKDQQIAALEAEIDRLKANVSTLLQEKDRINAELMIVKSSWESTLKDKDDELRECKEKLSLKEQEIYRMREVLHQAQESNRISNILPGTDIVGETQLTLIETNKSSYFEWKGYGLKLHIPENALPQEVDHCTLNIRAILSGQFELPPEHILASAVYQIKASAKLARPVILEIQHCCSFENSDSTSLCFVVAHTESELPYRFQKLEGGKFTSNYSYGSISLDHFSCFGIGGWLRSRFSRLYCAQLYRICQHNATDWRLHFGITKNLDSAITGMKKKLEEDYHPDAKVLVDFKFSVQFQNDEITLSIPKEGVEIEGWKISSRYYPSITRAEVDSGSTLGCLLDIHWTKQQQPVYLEYEVILEGAKSSRGYKYFTIRYAPLQAAAKPTPPPFEGRSASSSASEMAPLHSGKETTQYKKVATKHDLIISTLSKTVSAETLADKLCDKQLIGDDIRSKAQVAGVGKDKIRPIIDAVLSKIELNSANYDEFIETLREFGDQADLIECIESAT